MRPSSLGDQKGAALKRLTIIPLCIVWAVGCSKADDSVNRRGQTLLGRVESNARDAKIGVIGDTASTLTALELLEPKNSEQVSAEFYSNIQIVSKIAEDKIIMVGKDGRSWIYRTGDDASLEALEPVTTPPSGQLYTMPDGKFWIVSPDAIGRRKVDDQTTDPTTVRAQSFPTSVLPGDKTKLRVLYAGPEDLILHLDTHVVVLSVQGTQIVNNPFSVAAMSPKLDAPITAAGKGANGAFWFAAGEKVVLAEPKGVNYLWTGYHLPTKGHADYSSLALWLDQSKLSAMGDVLMMQDGKFWSLSGSPVTP